MLNHLLRPVVRQARSGVRSYKPTHFKPPSMNDLPVPQGSWQEHYNKQQRVYNAELAAGIICLVGTIIIANRTGWIYLNAIPPELKKD